MLCFLCSTSFSPLNRVSIHNAATFFSRALFFISDLLLRLFFRSRAYKFHQWNGNGHWTKRFNEIRWICIAAADAAMCQLESGWSIWSGQAKKISVVCVFLLFLFCSPNCLWSIGAKCIVYFFTLVHSHSIEIIRPHHYLEFSIVLLRLFCLNVISQATSNSSQFLFPHITHSFERSNMRLDSICLWKCACECFNWNRPIPNETETNFKAMVRSHWHRFSHAI